MKPLFGYGTFRRTAWRNAILGADYPAHPATLHGYRRVACASGYLSLKETTAGVALVHGMLIELDEIGWRVADAWEGVPLYRRVDVVVNGMHGPVEASAYLCFDGTATTPVDDDRLALVSDEGVNAAIEGFGATMRALRGRGA